MKKENPVEGWMNLIGLSNASRKDEAKDLILARARAQGTPLGWPRVSVQVTQAVLAARGQGKGIKRLARELDIGVGTVQRIIKEDAGRIWRLS